MPEEKELECCGFLCVHERTVARVLEEMPCDEHLYDLAELSTPEMKAALASSLLVTMASEWPVEWAAMCRTASA